MVVLDVTPFTTEAVPESDRYAISKRRGLVNLSIVPGQLPLQCLRRHKCAVGEETEIGLRLYAERCPLCAASCLRGELVSNRPVLVDKHPRGEFVPVKHEFRVPIRYWLARATYDIAKDADRYTPHWRLCEKLADWRARIADKVSIRACTDCGQPLTGPVTEPAHRSCREVSSIYRAALQPYDTEIWDGLPGAEPKPKRRSGEADQCVKMTTYGLGQCQRRRDTELEFTARYTEFCSMHNPARMCWRATRSQRPCTDRTGDGSACDYHEGLPRLDHPRLQHEHEAEVTDQLERALDPEATVATDQMIEDVGEVPPDETETDRPRFHRDAATWKPDASDTTAIGELPPKLPTPWSQLNDRLHGGFDLGQLVSISSGNHRYASKMLETQFNYLRDNGYTAEWLNCHRDTTTIESVIDWAAEHVENDVEALFIDWFPRIAHADRDGSELDDEPRRPEEHTSTTVLAALRELVAESETTVFLGAMMEFSALDVAEQQAVVHYSLRADDAMADFVRTILLCFPDKHGSGKPVGWLRKAQSDVDGLREPFPLTR
ncbi:hypothetical protein [Lentzea sp. NBRC 105346]|uniref:hypothetical protein n=1 Tax=Lentzea sp. NBRC 105346 TaxID=3032205 RepID=UPI0025528F36|nr:hypothetical protein [Lentzea sp. NBRC 105346]